MTIANKSFKASLMNENGGRIKLVPFPKFLNEAPPDFWIPDDSQKYDIGCIFDYGDKRMRYAKAGGTVGPNMGVKPYGHQAVVYVSIQAAALQYATSIYVTCTANCDDGQGSGDFDEDVLKGGQIIIYPAAGADYCFTRGIIGNAALSGSDTTMRIDLDAPIPYALTTSDYAEAIASPWRKVVLGTGTVLDQGKCSVCGVPMVRATSGQYLWVQTRGPVWVSPAATLGNADNNQRGAWFQGDGSLCSEDNNADAVLGQYAGWVMFNDYGGGQGAPFVWLALE
jgi:hypothetical protein